MSKGSHCQRTFMSLMHELEELIDNCLQKFPVRFEEARILTNNVHDI